MKIIILKDIEGAKANDIVECDEVQAKQLIEQKEAQSYEEVNAKDIEEIESKVKQEVDKQLQVEKKNMENKEVDFVLGKMFKQIAKKSVTGMSEGTAGDGGNLVATGIAQLAPLVFVGSQIFAKTSVIPVQPNCNAMKLPVDSSADFVKGTAPIFTNPGEGTAYTATKLSMDARTLTLTKSGAAIAITDELLEDDATVDAYVRSVLTGKLASMLDLEVLKGSAAGFVGIVGDTNYCVSSSVSATPTLAELQAIVNHVHPVIAGQGAEWFMSITDWALYVNTFATAANINNQLIDVANKKLFNYPVQVVPSLASGDVIFGNPKYYTRIEAPMGASISVSKDVRFLEGEVVFKIQYRGAGALSYYKKATGDSSYVSSFAEKA